MPPHSPGYCSETDGLYPRSFHDAFHPPSTESRTLIELLQSHASSSSTPSLPSIAIGIAAPSSARPGSNAAAGAGPGVADRGPGGRRKPHPDMRIEITTTDYEDSLERPSPRAVPLPEDWNNGTRRSSAGVSQHGSRAAEARRSSGGGNKRQTLTVPTKYSSAAKDSDCSSSAGLSPRASPRSSRSPSSSSPSPEPLWFRGSGSSSPDQNVPYSSSCSQTASNPSLQQAWSSSSKHRPLGLSSEPQQHCGSVAASTGGLCSSLRQPGTTTTTSSTETSPDWHETRWTGWGRMGKQKADELQEQETLV